MVDANSLALIHAEIDGELDEHSRAQLSRLLLADPAARALRDELRRTCAALDAIPEAEPPAELLNAILGELPMPDPVVSPSAQRAWWRAPAFRYAAFFAGALVAGAVLVESRLGRGPAPGEVAGTMASAPTTLDTMQLGEGPVTGRVSLMRDSNGLAVELELAASGPIDVKLASEGRTIRVSGLGAAGPKTRVNLPQSWAKGPTVGVTVLSGNQAVSAGTLKADKGS
jgi:hypothetical protein